MDEGDNSPGYDAFFPFRVQVIPSGRLFHSERGNAVKKFTVRADSGDDTEVFSERTILVAQNLLTKDPIVNSMLVTYTRGRSSINPVDAAYLGHFVDQYAADVSTMRKAAMNTQAKIIELSLQVAQLCCNIVEKNAEIKVAQCLKAPIRSLPSEILDIIFENCLPAGKYRPNIYEAPFLLCQVCKVWREAAVLNPRLWDSLSINFDGPGVSNHKGVLEMFTERSRGRPLLLHIKDDYDVPLSNEMITELWKMIPLSKCRKLRLEFRWTRSYNTLVHFEPMTSTFDNLSSLSFSYELFSHSLAPLTIFRNAPRLETVFINIERGDRESSHLNKIELPLGQLRNFTFRQVVYNDVDSDPARVITAWKVHLRRCNNLECVRFILLVSHGAVGNFNRLLAGGHNQVVVLGRVNRLHIINSLYGNSDIIFQGISFPYLQELYFEAVDSDCRFVLGPGDEPIDANAMYITLAGLVSLFSSLTHLTLLRVFIEEDDFLPIFCSTPHLTYLKLHNDWKLVALLSAKAPERMEDCLLPRLLETHLVVTDIYSYIRPRNYIPMAKARGKMAHDLYRDHHPPGKKVSFTLRVSLARINFNTDEIKEDMIQMKMEAHHTRFTYDGIHDDGQEWPDPHEYPWAYL